MATGRKQIKEAGEYFASDAKALIMTVFRDDGLYRHVRFKPEEHGFTWFDLVTWPGVLAIRGRRAVRLPGLRLVRGRDHHRLPRRADDGRAE